MKYPFVSGFVIGGALVATASIYLMAAPSEIPDLLSDENYSSTMHGCSFGIVRSDGVIQAVDWNVLQPIGFFEKFSNGKIGLITPSGYAGDVTKCFEDRELRKYLPEITTAKY